VIGFVRRVLQSFAAPVVINGTVPVGQEPDLLPPPGNFSVTVPAPAKPDWSEMPIHEEIFHRARLACASYCVRNDLSSAELKDLLEMLGLDDGEVFSQTWSNRAYSSM